MGGTYVQYLSTLLPTVVHKNNNKLVFTFNFLLPVIFFINEKLHKTEYLALTVANKFTFQFYSTSQNIKKRVSGNLF